MASEEPSLSTQKPSEATSQTTINASTRTTSKIMEVDANTSLKLTTILLNNHNYPIWVKAAANALCGKGRYGFVTGRVKRPLDDDGFEEWF